MVELCQRLSGVECRERLPYGLHPTRFTLGESIRGIVNNRFKDEVLNIELFTSVQEAKLLAEQYRIEYNTYRPHSALQGRTPLEILYQWKAA